MELARQLTIIQSHLWKEILPLELVGQAWSKEGKEEMAPHLLVPFSLFTLTFSALSLSLSPPAFHLRGWAQLRRGWPQFTVLASLPST